MDANTEMTEVLELSTQDFNAAMIKILQPAIMNMFETNEKKKKESFRKEMRYR